MDTLNIIRELAVNTALLLALALLYSALREMFSVSIWLNEQRNLLLGLLFGLAAATTMLFPVTVVPGIIYDVRVIIVALAAVFGGLPVGGIAAGITVLVRLAMGGAGAWVGAATIGTALIMGMVVHRRNRRHLEATSSLTFLALGALLALEVALLQFLLPVQTSSEVVAAIWLPLLALYPPGMVLVGLLLRHDLRRQVRWQVLHERETQYRLLFDYADVLAYVFYNGRYELINRRFEDFTGKTLDELNASEDDPFDWIAPAHHEMIRHRVQMTRERRVHELPPTYELETVNKDGRRVLLEASVTYVLRHRSYATYVMLRDITARKAAETALRQAEARNRALLEAIPDYIIRLGADGQYLELHGRHPRGLNTVSVSMADIVPPHLVAEVQQAMQQVLTTGDVETIEAEFTSPDGTHGVYEARVTPINGQNEVLAIVRDVTEQKAAEAALRRAHEAEAGRRRFAEVLRETAAQVSGLLQFDHVMKAVIGNVSKIVLSDAANIMVIEEGRLVVTCWAGFKADVPEPYTELSFPLQLPNFHEMFETRAPLCIADTTTYPGWVNFNSTNWVRSYLGMPIQVRGQITGFLNLDSATPGYFTPEHVEQIKAFVEQTGLAVALENAQLYDTLQQERLELEQRVAARTAELSARTVELSTERARLNTILDTMQEGVIYYETARKMEVYVNGAFTRLTGHSRDDIAQQRDLMYRKMLLPDYERDLAQMRQTVYTGGIWQRELRLVRKDDSIFDASMTICPVFDGTGESIIGHVVVIRDISQEQEFRQRQIRFIANASHELRTPVTTIRLRTYLLRKLPDEADKHLEVMDKEVERIASLVDDLMTVSRFERNMIELDRQPVDLCQIVSDAVQTQQALADQAQIGLLAETGAPCTLRGDISRLSQAVNNVLFNAISYTPPGEQVRIAIVIEDAQAAVHICDSGERIPPDELPHVFEPFYRINKGQMYGTGLGLNIAKEIIERHGGTVRAANLDGQTSNCIILTLPRQ